MSIVPSSGDHLFAVARKCVTITTTSNLAATLLSALQQLGTAYPPWLYFGQTRGGQNSLHTQSCFNFESV
jgi:hypothetical protein